MSNGLTLNDLFKQNNGESLGYADIILMPGFISFPTSDVNLSAQLTRNIRLNVPFVSSPMDTVTESGMAIVMALNGGIGIVHCNNTIGEQVEHIQRVKRYCNGFITDPVVVSPDDNVDVVLSLLSQHHFSGFPVVDGGGVLVGMISKGDVDLVEDTKNTRVSQVMCAIGDLVSGWDGMTLAEAHEQIVKFKVKRLPIIDKECKLKSMVCRKDIRESKTHPLASISPVSGKLLVGAAVTTHPRDRERVAALVAAGADVIVLDSALGSSIYQIEALKWIKETYPTIDVIAGNVVTASQAKMLINAGADGLRVGCGIGSICTTQDVCGVGRGQASTVFWTSQECKFQAESGNPGSKRVPIIADGGIAGSGDIIKALALGADCVMMGGLMAACDESPGETVIHNGVKLKRYRGMGAKTNKNSQTVRSRYGVTESIFVPQGVEGRVVSSGSVNSVVPRLAQAVRQGFQDIGIISVEYLRTNEKAHWSPVNAERRSAGAQLEGNVHHLYSYEK
jgi:IMP dehydrogenase